MGSEMCIRDRLCGALNSSAEKSPRQTRQLSFISEFTTSIKHVAGSANVVADTLSRPPGPAADDGSPVDPVPVPGVATLHGDGVPEVAAVGLTSPVAPAATDYSVVDLPAIAQEQALHPEEMDSYRDSSLNLEWSLLPGTDLRLLCDYSLAKPRPVIPASLVPSLLSGSHALVHPGGNAFLRDLRRRYVWHSMASQAKAFCHACVPCQRSKITKHTKAPLQDLPMPDFRFSALHIDLVGPLPPSEGYSCLLYTSDAADE